MRPRLEKEAGARLGPGVEAVSGGWVFTRSQPLSRCEPAGIMNGWCAGGRSVATWAAAGYPTRANNAQKSQELLVASAFSQVGDGRPRRVGQGMALLR